MKHIGFKSYPWLFDQLELGRKTWDARFDDWTDARHYELHFSHTSAAGPKQDVETITFVSTEDYNRRITFRYDRMEFVDWAPGWTFLVLGERVETPTEIDFGPGGLAIDEPVVSPLAIRIASPVIMPLGRWILPPLVERLPARLRDLVKNALPCVFGKPVIPHVQCYCTTCGESFNSATHHPQLGTHRYQPPTACPHQAVGPFRTNDWVL